MIILKMPKDMFYSYLNLENTKTHDVERLNVAPFYSYLNLENTKTRLRLNVPISTFYSYLNLENTKTFRYLFC